ncbi:hypothetical protein K388_05960 [Streptomyces sp. KhCrAH-43]|nr:hypothetical protein K388_05960 [Streptomyces sp. KhCrAH-43]
MTRFPFSSRWTPQALANMFTKNRPLPPSSYSSADGGAPGTAVMSSPASRTWTTTPQTKTSREMSSAAPACSTALPTSSSATRTTSSVYSLSALPARVWRIARRAARCGASRSWRSIAARVTSRPPHPWTLRRTVLVGPNTGITPRCIRKCPGQGREVLLNTVAHVAARVIAKPVPTSPHFTGDEADFSRTQRSTEGPRREQGSEIHALHARRNVSARASPVIPAQQLGVDPRARHRPTWAEHRIQDATTNESHLSRLLASRQAILKKWGGVG